jgi:hypothetical protein
MITLIDIQNSIGKKLDSKFSDYYIYTEDVKNGKKTPSFFINTMPVITDNFISYKEKLINIDIMYFSENETNEENLNMTNMLEDLFRNYLELKDRIITILSLNFRVIDNILHCNFSLNFKDAGEMILINTQIGQVYIQEHEINEKLGYTQDTITTMQELESEVE